MKALACVLLGLALASPLVVQAQTSGPAHKPGGFHSPPVFAYQTWNLTLEAEGTYYYHCHPHPWMTGTIKVDRGADEASPLVRMTNYTFTPADVRARPGAAIEFVNEDNDTHFVTESLPPSSDAPGVGFTGVALASMAGAIAWTNRRRSRSG